MSDQRDDTSAARDVVATNHDARADARDRRADAREHLAGGLDPAASADRAAARRDRRRGADDRRFAAVDRVAAKADRTAAADELASAAIDGLTGALRRDTGTIELEREAARATRTGQRFAVAFVDVVGLKAINDQLGHAAGDDVLRQTAAAIRRCLRSYDLLVRFGGDEFVCGMVDMTTADAKRHFREVDMVLASGPGAAVTVGCAELLPAETIAHLIARADAEMYHQRRG